MFLRNVLDLFRDGAATERVTNMSQDPGGDVVSRVSGGKAPADAAELYARGKYGECTNLLASRLPLLPTKDLQRLAFCAYSSANFQPAAMAAQKLAVNAATEGEGLYWETRSVQKLATNALARASQLDSNSPKFHVLLGDVYRQRKYFPDAEQEYRKALALNAEDTGALFGLSLTLLANSDLDEALRVTQAALTKNPDDPEFNAVMGEILSIQHDFAGAEPYLKKGLSTKPELVPHVHALLGRVYAETNRTAGSDHGVKTRARRRQGWTSSLSDCPALFEGRGSRFSQTSLCRVRSTTTGRFNPGSGRNAARREQQRFSIKTILNTGLHTCVEDCDSVCR